MFGSGWGRITVRSSGEDPLPERPVIYVGCHSVPFFFGFCSIQTVNSYAVVARSLYLRETVPSAGSKGGKCPIDFFS